MPDPMNAQPTGTADANPESVAETTTAPAPDLTPAQVQQTTRDATPVEVPAAPSKPVETSKPEADKPTAKTQERPSAAQADAASIFASVKKMSAGELDILIHAIEAEMEDSDDGADVALDEPSTSQRGRGSVDDDDEPIGYARLDTGTQRAIGAVHGHMVEQAITQALDSDQELAYNMKLASPKMRDSVRSIVRDRLQQIVDARGDRFNYDWEYAAREAVAGEKGRLTPFFERPARPGMGPGSQTDFQVNRELKPPERVPAFADSQEYDEYLMNRMRYNQSVAERELGNVPGA